MDTTTTDITKNNPGAIITFEDLIKNPLLQRIIVVSHYLRKKSAEVLAKQLNINPLDLRFFLNSAEAFSIYRIVKEEFENAPKVDSIEELHEALIDKMIDFLYNCSPSEAADITEKMIPQILNVSMVLDKVAPNPSSKKIIENADYTVESTLSGDNYSTLQLEKRPPKLYSLEDLEEINNNEEKKDNE